MTRKGRRLVIEGVQTKSSCQSRMAGRRASFDMSARQNANRNEQPQKSCSLGAKPWLQFLLPSDLPVAESSPMVFGLYCFCHVCDCHEVNRASSVAVAVLCSCPLGEALVQLLLQRQVHPLVCQAARLVTLCLPSSLCFLSTTHSSFSKTANNLVCNTSIKLPLCPAPCAAFMSCRTKFTKIRSMHLARYSLRHD